MTYFGGNGPDDITDLQFSATNGDVYVLMTTDSTDLKATVEASTACPTGCGSSNPYMGSSQTQDFYVAKFDPSGETLLFATYVGGSSDDEAIALKLDTDGTIYLYGQSRSQDYPLVNAFNRTPPSTNLDANDIHYYANVLTRLSADGSTILYSTYFGDGSAIPPQTNEYPSHRLALGGNGVAYISGSVYVNGGVQPDGSFLQGNSIFRAPLFPQGQEYIAKFDTTLAGDASLIYATPIGSASNVYVAHVVALGLDSLKNLWVYGDTNDSSFPTPTSNAIQMAPSASTTTWLMEINSAGTHVNYATFFGGSAIDDPYDMELDSNDNIYVFLNTESTDYPQKNAAYGFGSGNTWAITRFGPGGTSVVYSSFVSDRDTAFGVGPLGLVAVAGGGDRGVPLKKQTSLRTIKGRLIKCLTPIKLAMPPCSRHLTSAPLVKSSIVSLSTLVTTYGWQAIQGRA